MPHLGLVAFKKWRKMMKKSVIILFILIFLPKEDTEFKPEGFLKNNSA